MGRGHYNFIYDDDDYYYDTVLVYIDGACFNNGRPYAAAGLGVWFNYGHAMNIAAPVRGPATNNRGEIQAATRAIYAAGNYGLDNIRIITDSHFLYDSVTDGWLDVWRDLDWTKTNGRPLANERDFQALDRALARNWHMNIEWEHVYAHSGDEGNDEADRLAKEGAQIYQDLYC